MLDRCPVLVLNGVKWNVLIAPTVEIESLADMNRPLREVLYDRLGQQFAGAEGCLNY